MTPTEQATIPCACGCGEPTKIATKTDRRYGHVKGEPMKYLPGHNLTQTPPASEYRDLPLAQIQTLPQVRVSFDAEALAELAASIREHGVIQPLIVRPAGGGYVLVAGERRLRAAREAGLTTVPVRVMELTDAQAARLQLVENLERKDLDPIEEAEGLDRLIREHGVRAVDLARELGMSEARISNRRRLLRLPEDVRREVSRGKIAAATALTLVPLSSRPDLVRQYARRLTEMRMPSAEAPAAIERWLCAPPGSPTNSTCVVELKKGFEGHYLCTACADHSRCPCRHALTGHDIARAVCLDPERYRKVEAEHRVAQQAAAAAQEDSAGPVAGADPGPAPQPAEAPVPGQVSAPAPAPQPAPDWRAQQREREETYLQAATALGTEVDKLAGRPDLHEAHLAMIAARLVFENDYRQDWHTRMRAVGLGDALDSADDGDEMQRLILERLTSMGPTGLLRVALSFAAQPDAGDDLTDWWRERCSESEG